MFVSAYILLADIFKVDAATLEQLQLTSSNYSDILTFETTTK
jgi:hypothetical protein